MSRKNGQECVPAEGGTAHRLGQVPTVGEVLFEANHLHKFTSTAYNIVNQEGKIFVRWDVFHMVTFTIKDRVNCDLIANQIVFPCSFNKLVYLFGLGVTSPNDISKCIW